MAARRLIALAIATLTVGAVGCAASTSGSTGTTSSPDPAVSASPVTAPLIPAASVVPTTLPTTVPTATPTPPAKPKPKPTRVPATPLAGRFKVVQTVAKSNRAMVPVGSKDSYSWTLTVLCDPVCAATPPGGNTKVKGRTWRYSFTSETVCYRLNSAGKKYDKKKGSTKSKAVLKFSKPSRGKPQTFTGTIKERLKRECPGYEGEFEPWAVDYKLKGTFAGTKQ